jgi:hypothetical protein
VLFKKGAGIWPSRYQYTQDGIKNVFSRWRYTMKRLLLGILLSCATFAFVQDSAMAASIEEIKVKHEAYLMGLPGVVSVGLGQDEHGKPAIIVGVDRPRPETEAQIPCALDDYPVVVRVIGPIKAQ